MEGGAANDISALPCRSASAAFCASPLVESYSAQQAFEEIVAISARHNVTATTDDQTILRMAESLDKTGSLGPAIQLLESAVKIKVASAPLYLAPYRFACGCCTERRTREGVQDSGRDLQVRFSETDCSLILLTGRTLRGDRPCPGTFRRPACLSTSQKEVRRLWISTCGLPWFCALAVCG